jgi:hypothetical protein
LAVNTAVVTLRELWLLVVLGAMLLIPGWAILSVGGGWRRWDGLQRWIVATGLGIAFYPILFYVLRALAPSLRLGPHKLVALLVLGAAWTVWRLRDQWRDLLVLDRQEWIAVAVIGMTLFSRFWIIRDQPYPAWSDSLHHALLTRLTAEQGQLPTSLEPYFPVPLEMYHLGLYAITAPVMWLARVEAHTALLWTSQLLNGLCGLGVYLVLDRKVGRLGAVVGVAVVGLLSHQPAFYVNWGRFTQVASQTILLIAWVVTWDAVTVDPLDRTGVKIKPLVVCIAAALLTAAVFILHFRVAAIYAPLLGITLLWELWRGYRKRQIGPFVGRVALVAVVALVALLPVLWPAGAVYVQRASNRDRAIEADSAPEMVQETTRLYYEYPWKSVLQLGVHGWLLGPAILLACIGIVRRNQLAILSLVWVLLLVLLGNAYRLGVSILNVTNMGAILIMLYLPVGLVIGSATEDVLRVIPSHAHSLAVRSVIVGTLVVGFLFSHVRAADVEPFRYFVQPQDVAAMEWIRENTPSDALFAVNTYFWLPQAPHGTDGGYWIPYFTGRRMTAGVMLMSLADQPDSSEVVEASRLVEELETGNEAISRLSEMGVDFSGRGLDVEQLLESADVELLYRNGKAAVLGIAN